VPGLHTEALLTVDVSEVSYCDWYGLKTLLVLNRRRGAPVSDRQVTSDALSVSAPHAPGHPVRTSARAMTRALASPTPHAVRRGARFAW
jgi:hypothetical protein